MTTEKKYRSESKYSDPSVLNKIGEIASERLDELLDELGVEYVRQNKYLAGPCPVHGGDNWTAFNLFFNGNTAKSNWACYTHGCHKTGIGNTLFGLVRGIYQARGKNISWGESVDYVCKFLKINIDDIKIDPKDKISKRTTNQFNVLNKKIEKPNKGYDVKIVRELLTYPAEYYLNRGFTKEILDRYDVGYCNNPDKPFYERCVFPVFDEHHESIIGFAARSIFEKCEICKGFHDTKKQCPPLEEIKRGLHGKWKNSPNFYAHRYLFNLWFAKDRIKETGYAILVEGPGDCLKLEELGITNSLALFGAFISEEQLMLLEQLHCNTLIVMTDNDKAGQDAAKQIKEVCGRLYRLYFPKFNTKDVGDFNKNNITSDIENTLKKLNKREILTV